MKSNSNDSKLIWEGMMSGLAKFAAPLAVNPAISPITGETSEPMVGDDTSERFQKGDFVQFVGDDGLKLAGKVVVHLPASEDPLLDAPQGWVGIDRTGNGSPDMIVKADNVKLIPSVDTSEHDPEETASRERGEHPPFDQPSYEA